MYSISNDIMYKYVDAYIFLYCSQINKNLKLLEKNFNNNKSFELNEYFKNEDNKILKIVRKDKIIIISKVSERACTKQDLDASIMDIVSMVKNEKKIKSVQIVLAPIKKFIDYQVMRCIYYFYEFVQYKTKKPKQIKKIYFCADKKVDSNMKDGILMAEIINFSRDMVNDPPNMLTSTKFLNNVKKRLSKNVKLTIFDKKKLKSQNLNLILAVNNASKNNPYMLILKYLPKKGEKPAVLIGKGVTFDAGGINLKYGSFHDMKTDMTGASVVFSVIDLCSKQKINKNVIVLIPLVENMINEKASRPGDVVVSHSKKTVEITNTDAEGRLIMADCLSYCKKFNPKYIIDVATLTGAIGSIFNNLSIGMMGNNNKMQAKYEEIASEAKERVWKLPLWSEYNKYLKSEIADIKNSNDSVGGQAMVAGSFLNYFVPKNVKWMHLDIAGVSFFEKNSKYKGATGISIESIYNFVKKY